MFRGYVSYHYGINKDGELSDAELSAVHEMRDDGYYLPDEDGNYNKVTFSSMKGIEFFTNLEKLYCTEHQLTELDVSRNTALKKLHCNGNKLATLDVSKCTALQELDCSGNPITALVIDEALERLEITAIHVAELNLSGHPNLQYLYLMRLPMLQSLNISV